MIVDRVSWMKGGEGCPYRSGTESVGRVSGLGEVAFVVVAAIGSSRLGDKAATYSRMRKGVFVCERVRMRSLRSPTITRSG